MRIAVTGICGIVGSTIHPALVDAGHEVVGIDHPRPVSQSPAQHTATAHIEKISVVCDLGRPLAECLAGGNPFEGCDVVIHLAGDGRPSARFIEDLLPNNVIATHNVFEMAKLAKVRRVIFASTNHVHCGDIITGTGDLDLQKIPVFHTEQVTDPPKPDSFYAISKLLGENLGWYYSHVERTFEFLALRIGWVLYDSPNSLEGQPYQDYLRSLWLSRRDCIGFFKAALTAPLPESSGIAFACSANATSIYDMAASVKLLGYAPQDGDDVSRYKLLAL